MITIRLRSGKRSVVLVVSGLSASGFLCASAPKHICRQHVPGGHVRFPIAFRLHPLAILQHVLTVQRTLWQGMGQVIEPQKALPQSAAHRHRGRMAAAKVLGARTL